MWTAAINEAITARLLEQIRLAGAGAEKSARFRLGLSVKGGRLSVSPALTYTYTATVPINETITIPAQNIAVLGGNVDALSVSSGDYGVDLSGFSMPETTLRLPAVTVQLGSPLTTVVATATVTVGGDELAVKPGELPDHFVLPQIPVHLDGSMSLNVPVEANLAGPITVDGFDLSGVQGMLHINSKVIAGILCLGSTCDEPFKVGTCASPSSCDNTVHIPGVTIATKGPLLTGVIGGQGVAVPVTADGEVGPVDVGILKKYFVPYGVTVSGTGGPGEDIPFALTANAPINIPLAAKVGDLRLRGLDNGTKSWTMNDLPSYFALWQRNESWSAPAPWSGNAGTNVILPVGTDAKSPLTVDIQMPTVTALAGGPDTALALRLTGGVGAIEAATGLSGISVGAAGGGEIPIHLNADVPVDVPVTVSATPVQISGGAGGPSTADPPAPDAPLASTPELAAGPEDAGPRLATDPGWLKSQLAAQLDRLGARLSAQSATPLNDALSEFAWLVRRTLAPVGADVGRWGSVPCVASKDCSGLDLTMADLHGRDLSGVNFTGTVLTQANLAKANLTGADLTGATLYRATLDQAILPGARLYGEKGSLHAANLTGASVAFAFAANADLSSAVLVGTNLTNTDLTEANLLNADLTRANLNSTSLLNATIAAATFTNARWMRTICPDGSKTNSGCSALPPTPTSTGPIVIPSIQLGQGAVRGVTTGLQAVCYTLVCAVNQVGISATVGSRGPLPGANPGIVIGGTTSPDVVDAAKAGPITVGFLDTNNIALAARIGGTGKGIGLDLRAGVGPVAVPLGGSLPRIPWRYSLDVPIDIPVDATVSAVRSKGNIVASIPYNVATWDRTGECTVGSCNYTGWGARITQSSGQPGVVRPPVVLPPTTVTERYQTNIHLENAG